MVFGKNQELPIIPNGMLGKHHSEESKRKIGLNISKALKGRKLSEEHKEKLSKIQKKRYKEGKIILKNQFKKGNVSWNKGQTYKCPKISKALKGKLKGRKILWIDKILQAWNYHPNKKEQQFNQLLQENFPNEFKFVGDGSVVIEGFCPDFINCNGKKLIIELFGEYHHKLPKVVKRDRRRLETYSKYGYNTLVIWSNGLKNSQEVLKQVRNFLCENSGTTPLKIKQIKENSKVIL